MLRLAPPKEVTQDAAAESSAAEESKEETMGEEAQQVLKSEQVEEEGLK